MARPGAWLGPPRSTTTFRSHLADLRDEVVDRRELVTITRHGRPTAVVIPVHEYEALTIRVVAIRHRGQAHDTGSRQ